MRKKVLVAEAVDTVRSVAETVLRQNGYEVIAVSEPRQIKDVLEFSRPDLIIISADMKADDQTPYYEVIRGDSRSSNLPLLLFEPSDKSDVGFPQEVVIPRPFDPKEFLSKVAVFLGQVENHSSGDHHPLGVPEVDDEFLDAALGLDRIDVTNSEIMDKTSTGLRVDSLKDGPQHTIGMEGQVEDSGPDYSKVESLMIRDEVAPIQHQSSQPSPSIEGSGKLEILNDQYGLSEAGKLKAEPEDQVHDYDWFVNTMRDEAQAKSAEPPSPPAQSDVDKLTFTDPAAVVNPVTPGPDEQEPPSDTKGPARASGVEKFIDEFKREIEQLRAGEPDDLMETSSETKPGDAKAEMVWDEKLEAVTSEQVAIFTQEFARELGARVAETIVAKIDSEKLLRMVKNELVQRIQKKR